MNQDADNIQKLIRSPGNNKRNLRRCNSCLRCHIYDEATKKECGCCGCTRVKKETEAQKMKILH